MERDLTISGLAYRGCRPLPPSCWRSPTAAAAQDYPTKPVRLIIPFPPGGSNDVVGRAIATQLSERLGKQVVVDNRGGAGGVIGTELAANAPKDGYTLLIVSIAHAVNPWLYKLPYDPIKSFAPISILASRPRAVVAVNPELPVNSIKELVALAKQKPGECNMRRPASAASSISAASCSSSRPASTCCMSRSRAAARR